MFKLTLFVLMLAGPVLCWADETSIITGNNGAVKVKVTIQVSYIPQPPTDNPTLGSYVTQRDMENEIMTVLESRFHRRHLSLRVVGEE